jgi:hypothetical protein
VEVLSIRASPNSSSAGDLAGRNDSSASSLELNSIDWSPKGGRFAVDDDANGVFVVAEAGTVLSTINDNGGFPRWSPDGTHILNLEKTGRATRSSSPAPPA